jgi:hypothetical protein
MQGRALWYLDFLLDGRPPKSHLRLVIRRRMTLQQFGLA